jgi:hypothetical protein
MFFNLNQKRTGRLFEYTFKAKHIATEELLLHVIRYTHLNPVIAHLVDAPDLWPWSSYLSTVSKRIDPLCDSQSLLRFFGRIDPAADYEKFVMDQRAYAQILHDAEDAKDEDALFL